MSELLVMFVFLAAALAVVLLFNTAKRPKKCRSCGHQAVVELCREPNGNAMISNHIGGDVATIIGSGRPSVVYMVTYKCKGCGEESTLQSSRRYG